MILFEVDIQYIGKNLNRNLSKLMEENSVSLSTLFRNTGIAIPTIKRLQSDPTTNPTITTLLPIANFFGITVTQLISNQPLPSGVLGYIENKSHWDRIPIINWNQVIDWLKAEDSIESNQFILVDIEMDRNAFALRVEEEDWLTIPKGQF